MERKPWYTSFAAVLLLIIPLSGGCASFAFQEGVKKPGADFAGELRTYTAKDKSLDVATRADNTAAADALQAATAANVTLQGVKSAWENFRPRYTPYVDGDLLLDLEEKQLRANNIARMDRLIQAEGQRFIYGGSSP